MAETTNTTSAPITSVDISSNYITPGDASTGLVIVSKKGNRSQVQSTSQVPSTKPLTNLPFVFSFQNLSAEFPGPAHFYSASNLISSDRWVLPVPPADFSITVPNSVNEITTINGFSYTHAGAVQLDEISFEGFFPYIDQSSSTLPGYVPEYISLNRTSNTFTYHSPKEWVGNLVTAMRSNQPLLFGIHANTDLTSEGMVVEPVAMSVTSFSWNMGTSVGGSRRDVAYSITLKRWRRQRLPITNFTNQKANQVVLSSTWPVVSGSPGTGGNTKVYVTVKGDDLHKIARKRWVLNDQSRAGDIYNYSKSNKKKIDDDYKIYKAKLKKGSKPKGKKSYPITPGIKLSIPTRRNG